MIGQSFAPLPEGGQPGPGAPAGGGATAGGPQQAISILKLRFPKLFGAGAPAPSQLLTSPGSAALPQPGGGAGGGMQNPSIQAILQAVLGAFNAPQQHAPSAPGGMMGAPSGTNGSEMTPFMPAVHYEPPPAVPGGTAGPNPPPPRVGGMGSGMGLRDRMPPRV